MDERTRDRLKAAQAFAEHAIVAGKRFDYANDPLGMAAVAHLIEQVGEQFAAVRRADPEFVASHPEIPWRKVEGMRHRVAHEYSKVDPEIVRGVLGTHLPALLRQIGRILR